MTEDVIMCCLVMAIAYFGLEESKIIISREKLKTSGEKTCSSVTSSTTKFKIIHRRLNLGLCGDKPEPNRQSYGTALQNETRFSSSSRRPDRLNFLSNGYRGFFHLG
jgi:hypothetical protein